MLNYQTGQLLNPTETNINESVNYTANIGNAAISTANTNLDGTGTIGTLLTAASNGTLIKTITIKALGNTTRGMIRFFIINGATFTRIIDEVDIPARIQSGTQDAFNITFDVDWCLLAGYALGVSTEKAESFVVTAEGLDYAYPSSINWSPTI